LALYTPIEGVIKAKTGVRVPLGALIYFRLIPLALYTPIEGVIKAKTGVPQVSEAEWRVVSLWGFLSRPFF
jgi:hypothetical protein